MTINHKLSVKIVPNGLEILVSAEAPECSCVMELFVIQNVDSVNYCSKFISSIYKIDQWEWFGVDATPEKPVKNQRRKIKKFLLEALTILG